MGIFAVIFEGLQNCVIEVFAVILSIKRFAYITHIINRDHIDLV